MKLSNEEKTVMDAEIKKAVQQACEQAGETNPAMLAKLEKAAYAVFVDEIPAYKALGTPDEIMEKAYALGYELYNSGKYKDAIVVFRTLLRNDGFNARYCYAVGACYHQLKDYEWGSNCYFMAACLDPKNPIPCYHMYNCCVELGDLHTAIVALEMVKSRSKDQPQFRQLFNNASIMQEKLIKNVKNKS